MSQEEIVVPKGWELKKLGDLGEYKYVIMEKLHLMKRESHI